MNVAATVAASPLADLFSVRTTVQWKIAHPLFILLWKFIKIDAVHSTYYSYISMCVCVYLCARLAPCAYC